MKWKAELAAGLALAVLLAALSWAHLAWGGEPLPGLLQRTLYMMVGGGMSGDRAPATPSPLIASLAEENERLHEVLALRSRLPGQAQAALVTRREPETWWSELEVEFAISSALPPKGTAIVLTAQGLIGTLDRDRLVVAQESGQTFARGTVSLLSSPETQLSVVVGESQSPFLLEGRGGDSFALRPVTSGAEKAISPGDIVQTSGLGKLYSKGLVVAQVEKDSRWSNFTPLASTPTEVLLWWR